MGSKERNPYSTPITPEKAEQMAEEQYGQLKKRYLAEAVVVGVLGWFKRVLNPDKRARDT